MSVTTPEGTVHRFDVHVEGIELDLSAMEIDENGNLLMMDR